MPGFFKAKVENYDCYDFITKTTTNLSQGANAGPVDEVEKLALKLQDRIEEEEVDEEDVNLFETKPLRQE